MMKGRLVLPSGGAPYPPSIETKRPFWGTEMKTLMMMLTAAALTMGFAIAPVAGGAPSPAGTWQISSGESRFKVEMCGDGTALCATLVWLRDDAKTPENLAYLNKMVIVEAGMARPMKWVGDVVYEGKTYHGNVTMPDNDTLRLAGCRAIACQSMTFKRV